MRGILTIFAKDWKLFMRDRLALILTFIVPVIVSAVIGFAVGGMTSGDINPLSVVICDQDDTPQTRQLVKDLSELKILDAEIIEPDEEIIKAKIDDVEKGNLPAVILIEKGFTEGLEGSRIRFINDPKQSIQAQIIYQSLIGMAMNIRGRELIQPKVEEWLAGRGMSEGMLQNVRKYFDESWGDMSSLFGSGDDKGGEGDEEGSDGGMMGMMSDEDAAQLGIVNEEVVGQEIDNPGYSQSVAGMAVMFVFFSLTHAAASLFTERDSGTLKRLLLSPLGLSTILFGKTLNIIAIAALQLIFLFTAGYFIFHLGIFRDPIQMLVFILATAFMAAGVGLFLASIASSAQSAGGLSTLFILVMASMGGAMFPSMFMPKWMQTVGAFTPVSWAMKGFQGIFWYQKPITEQLGLLLVIILWGVGFITIGILIFRKKLGVK